MVKDERKNLEFKVKMQIKNVPLDEYEAVMKLYKKYMLQFERNLRTLADDNKIAFKILDKIGEAFRFDEIHYMKFSTPEEETFQVTAPRPAYSAPTVPNFETAPLQPPPRFVPPIGGPIQNVPPSAQVPPSTFAAESPTPMSPRAPSESATVTSFGQKRSAVDSPASSLRESIDAFSEASSAEKTVNEPKFTFGETFSSQESKTQPGFAATEPPSIGFSTPSIATPKKEAVKSAAEGFSFTIPPISSDLSPSTGENKNISIGADEEDRATGIAILRRKMLMELRKIRNVVEEQTSQDDNF